MMQGRRRQLRTRQDLNDEVYKIDPNKTPEENTLDILQTLYLKNSSQNVDGSPLHSQTPTNEKPVKTLSDNRRASFLNALVTLLSKDDTRNKLGFTTEEMMLCLRISLVDESVHIRATALRVLRYIIRIESDVDVFNKLRLPYLVVRSMDLLPRNEVERAQALRVVRRIIAVVGIKSTKSQVEKVDIGLLRCLVSIARSSNNGNDQGSRDWLARPCIATLAEIGVLNPPLFIACDGVSALTRFLLECSTPLMAEALCGVLLHILDQPTSRMAAKVDLKCLAAPYCDFHSKNMQDKIREEREKRFTCSRLSLVCVLRSWPGTLHFCNPRMHCGLRSLVHSLYLNHREVRRAILDLLYELLGLPQPEWTDEISVALAAVDPSDFQDTWRLTEGFVAAEGRAILPHLASTGPDIMEIHLSFLLYCFLDAGLFDGLAEVIVSSDTFISVRATILLGQLLHLTHMLVPSEIRGLTPPLPTLLQHAAVGKPHALAAVAALQKLHNMLEQRPATSSLFLDHIVHYCAGVYQEGEMSEKPILEKSESQDSESDDCQPAHRHSFSTRDSTHQGFLVKSNSLSSKTSAVVSKVAKSTKLFNIFDREKDNLMRDSLVMQHKEGTMWDWSIIRAILREDREKGPLLSMSESNDRQWLRRVMQYFKPSHNKYSHADIVAHGHQATIAACQLIRLSLKDNEGTRILEELFQDVNKQLKPLLQVRQAHNCLFSPQHMSTTMCQMYFLFVGQLCHSHAGLKLFHDIGLHDSLLELSTKSPLICYVQLVISSLDYTLDSYPREILEKTLTCNLEASRKYATEFLNVLLRASQKSGDLLKRRYKTRHRKDRRNTNGQDRGASAGGKDMESWLLEMLVIQIKDECKEISRLALEILEEACNVPTYLDRLVAMRDKVSVTCGIDRTNYLNRNIDPRSYLLWLRLHLVAAVKTNCDDEFIKQQLDYWTSSYNSRYSRLIEGECMRKTRVVPPIHPLGLVTQHVRRQHLIGDSVLRHLQCLKQARCSNEQEIMDLKSSLWSLGNTARTIEGVNLLIQMFPQQDDNVFTATIALARDCPVYSVRAVAFYTLGLMGSTYLGANVLYQLGWACVRHTRHEKFPLNQEENWIPRSTSSEDMYQHIEMSEQSDHSLAESFSERHERTLDMKTYLTSIKSENSTTESLHSDQFRVNVDLEETQDSDVIDGKINIEVTPPKHDMERKKSSTLPQRSIYQHDRSLSESKTVDILRDAVIYENSNEFHINPIPEYRLLMRGNSEMEGRIRNPSESSTSGVSSSYESVYGRYVLSDKVLTLSPIPSSSSVSGFKGVLPKKRTEPRRISFTSIGSASPASVKDIQGIATIRALNIHRRPHLSESSATEDLWRTSRQSLPRHKNALSLLKNDWKPLQLSEDWCTGIEREHKVGSFDSTLLTERPLYYRGICLPKDIMHLFPEPDSEFSSNIPSSSDTFTETMMPYSKDTRCGDACLSCGRAPGPTTAQLREAFFTGIDNTCIGPHSLSTHSKGSAPPASLTATSLELSCSCPTSASSALDDAPTTLLATILKHARYLANPLWFKTSKTTLIVLKQKHPEAFQNVCLYSEVSRSLSECNYLMSARRFLQELFLDLSFECFIDEPQQIIISKRSCVKIE